MYITIGNKIVNETIENILDLVRIETSGDYLKNIRRRGDTLMVTCPFHADHRETHPSCGVCIDPNSEYYGVYHCFTCQKKGYITELIGECFGQDYTFGEEWLMDRFGFIVEEEQLYVPPFEIVKDAPIITNYMDESVLNEFNCLHPYMFQRKLTKEVIAKFKIGYDKKSDSITFPVWDDRGHLVSITRRSVSGKRFKLEESKSKPVYLLNFIKRENVSRDVYVCESQINALTCWGYGYKAIALLGTGSKNQYELLNKSGIRHYILSLDGDKAGRNGTKKLINNLRNCTITVVDIPNGKDVNDLTREEFDSLPRLSTDDWENKYKSWLTIS